MSTIRATKAKIPQEIKTQSLILCDAAGNTRARLYLDNRNQPRLSLLNQSGDVVFYIVTEETDAAIRIVSPDLGDQLTMTSKGLLTMHEDPAPRLKKEAQS